MSVKTFTNNSKLFHWHSYMLYEILILIWFRFIHMQSVFYRSSLFRVGQDGGGNGTHNEGTPTSHKVPHLTRMWNESHWKEQKTIVVDMSDHDIY